MKKNSLFSIIVVLCGLTAIGMLSGYYIGIKKTNQKPQPSIENVVDKHNAPDDTIINNAEIDEDEDYEAGLIDEERIGPNTILEYKTHFEECNHETVETKALEKHMINMTKNAFEEYIKGSHPKWEVESFSHEKIVVKIHKNHLCQAHYIIGEKNGKIAVFKVGENGEWLVEKIYNDSPISLLKEVDQEKIEKGIVVDSEEELDNILENYIS